LPVADGEILALCQDMTISRDAFLRGLPAAVDHAAFRVEDGEIGSLDPRRPWRIVLEPLADLRLGMIVLPRQRVRIFLTGYDGDATRRFLERFELYYRRAGG
jgi:hypothetical protein